MFLKPSICPFLRTAINNTFPSLEPDPTVPRNPKVLPYPNIPNGLHLPRIQMNTRSTSLPCQLVSGPSMLLVVVVRWCKNPTNLFRNLPIKNCYCWFGCCNEFLSHQTWSMPNLVNDGLETTNVQSEFTRVSQNLNSTFSFSLYFFLCLESSRSVRIHRHWHLINRHGIHWWSSGHGGSGTGLFLCR